MSLMYFSRRMSFNSPKCSNFPKKLISVVGWLDRRKCRVCGIFILGYTDMQGSYTYIKNLI